jgi:type 2A phosphatase activator TIP41
MSSDEIDSTTASIGIPLPEMIFGDNRVEVKHLPSGWSIQFNAVSALDLVDKTGQQGLLKVAHSHEWLSTRKSTEQDDVKGILKPFDWTYTTSYIGEENSGSEDLKLCEDKGVIIPVDKLKLPDPILFFDDVCLYEDELGDNGIVNLSIKVRVMPERMLLLSRMFLRVDDVVFRIRDTRVFVEFSEGVVIREYLVQEQPYSTVKGFVPPGVEDYGHFLRDHNWVSKHMAVESRKTEYLCVNRSVASDERA